MEKINIKPAEKEKPKVVPKITKVSGILESSNKLKRNSLKLRKTFERGTYQKRTQLSVLKRYKRRLDAIELEDERSTRRKSKKKINLPNIKKFAGNFFAPGASDDPLKAIGALSAFNAATKASSGDWLGAIGPALVAGGSILGPGLISAGIGNMLGKGGKIPRGFDKFGRRVSVSSQERYLQRYGDKAFKNRFGKNNLKSITTGASEVGENAPKIAKAFGRFGKAIIPGVGAVVGAIDATMRAQEGDVTGASIAGTSAALDAYAAASAATGVGLPVAGLLSIASFGLDVINLVRDLSGASEREVQTNKPKKDRLKNQTEKQKQLIEREKNNSKKLTFGKTLNSYENAINKFENFAKGFSGGIGMSQTQVRPAPPPSSNPSSSGDPSEEYESSGGDRISTTEFTRGMGVHDNLGSGRSRFGHTGRDVGMPKGTPISLIYPGQVIDVGIMGDARDPGGPNGTNGGYGNFVVIKLDDGRIVKMAHFDKVFVKPGDRVGPGTGQNGRVKVIGNSGETGLSSGAHLHAEVGTGYNPINAQTSGLMNPDSFILSGIVKGGNVISRRREQSAGQSNVFPLELHAVSPGEAQREGLYASYIDPETGASTAIKREFGSYEGPNVRQDLGGPRRGLNLLETDMRKGVEANAQRIIKIIRANPNQMFELFAGHNDVTRGETGTPGEQRYTRELAERIEQLARQLGLRNVRYNRSIIANDPNDPNANWNRAARLRVSSTPQLTPRSSRSRFIQQYPSYDPRSQRRQIITIPISTPNQQQKVVQSKSSKSMIISGPSEEEVLNSFYKRILLNTLV